MKIIVDLENQVVSKNLIEYVKDSLNIFSNLLQVDCNFEIVNYETRPDIEEDDILFKAITVAKQQVFSSLDIGTAQNPPTPYKC